MLFLLLASLLLADFSFKCRIFIFIFQGLESRGAVSPAAKSPSLSLDCPAAVFSQSDQPHSTTARFLDAMNLFHKSQDLKQQVIPARVAMIASYFAVD